MRRVLAASLLVLGCALALPALLSLARQPQLAAARTRTLRAPASDARACKPQPPVELRLQQTGADDDVVTLAFAVTPHADAGALRWSLALPPGAELLDGAAAGALPAGSAGTGPLSARVALPAGADGLQLALHIDGELSADAGAAGERLRGRRVLTWGRPATAGRQLVRLDAERLAATPTRHREGR
jgi:hypothetical protein